MNTLVHVIALVVVCWFAWWLFDRGQAAPGLGVLGVGLVLMAWTIQAMAEDLGDLRRRRQGRR